MKRLFATLVFATVGLLGLANSASADVRDNGRLFSPETVTEARTIIKDIEAKFKHSVTVETFATIPDDKKSAFDKAKKNKTDAASFYHQWAVDRAKASGKDGVFILITKTPGHVEVLADRRENRTHEFTGVDAQDLARQLVNDFKEKKFDTGLIAALDSVRNTMQAHRRDVRQAPIAKPSANPEFKPETKTEKGHSIMGTICVVAGIVLLFWVIIGLIRSFTGAGRQPMNGMGYQNGPPGYAPQMGGGGGGGMFNSFLGGMFGAVAGNWMYNSFFGGGHSMGGGGFDSPAYGGDRPAGGNDGAGDWNGGAGAGGDFGGEDAGGGGGGDFGGGDAGGGGDWGGGGGDWGGGGGDFGGDSGGGGDF